MMVAWLWRRRLACEHTSGAPTLILPACCFTYLCHAEGQRFWCSHGSRASPAIHVIQEGELRPQLLDRFGMSVNVYTMQDIASRTRMVLDRMAFEKVCPVMRWTPLPALQGAALGHLGCQQKQLVLGHERAGWHLMFFRRFALHGDRPTCMWLCRTPTSS